MNIYLISQEVNCNYDTYDSAVVIAENEENAKLIHPMKGVGWDGIDEKFSSWCAVEDVKCEFIGVAKECSESDVVTASFNAG